MVSLKECSHWIPLIINNREHTACASRVGTCGVNVHVNPAVPGLHMAISGIAENR